ncbi:amidohydrolase [Microlunatus endophyticus]|uniref:Amidohydrolase n=1 Tax=Microlunatus endophyticus TaxID=1716077 RepID=A0A917SAD2_9ACTN|nr:amidohydrolase family protein [Microlunatus endophyticus]GGL64671.1 amidohydrolase [Microlunatus endophyticus]
MKLYTAGLVLTQDAGRAYAPGAVLVDDGKIIWVGAEADFPLASYPPDLVIESLGDATIMPGLIDAHVHLGFDGGPKPVERMMAEDDVRQVALMLQSARQLLSVGVTTARDLGSRDYLGPAVRDIIQDGTARGPRILTAASPITVTGGHCWFMGGEADSISDVRTMVRRHHKFGADLIKVMSTGGFMTAGSAPWYAQFEQDQLSAIVSEARRVGKQVAAHAHGIEGIERAVTAGVTTIEHCSFVHADGSRYVDPELADRIAASQSYVSPTINYRMPQIVELTQGRFQPALAELYRRGCKIIASTDCGIDNTPHHGFPGALEAMVSLGLPAQAVLDAATSVSATALGISDVTGRLAVGLDADLIAVGGDPRSDISVISDLRLVVSRGVAFIPDPLPPLEPLDPTTLSPFLRAAAASDPGVRHDPQPAGAVT